MVLQSFEIISEKLNVWTELFWGDSACGKENRTQHSVVANTKLDFLNYSEWVIENFRGSLQYGPDPSFTAITGSFKLQQQVKTKTYFIHDLWLKVCGTAGV